MKRTYLIILAGFFLYLILINLVTSAEGLGKLFYLRERSAAAIALVKHVTFESGIFLPEIPEEAIVASVVDACKNSNVEPALAMLIISHTGGSYSINFDGSFGLMRLKLSMLPEDYEGDPFIYSSNIKAGIDQLNKLIAETGSLENALLEYMKPNSISATGEDVAKMRDYAQGIYAEYIASIVQALQPVYP